MGKWNFKGQAYKDNFLFYWSFIFENHIMYKQKENLEIGKPLCPLPSNWQILERFLCIP